MSCRDSFSVYDAEAQPSTGWLCKIKSVKALSAFYHESSYVMALTWCSQAKVTPTATTPSLAHKRAPRHEAVNGRTICGLG